MTAVSPASAAPPLPQLHRRRRPRGGVAEPPPTGVVDVQLVRDALVAPAEDDHQLPDGYGSVSVPGAGHRPGEGGNPPPVEEAGSRHLPNPRPSAHNAPRATGPTARGGSGGGETGHRLQRCAREARHVTRGPRPPHGPRPPQPAATWLALGAPPGWGAPPVHRPCLPLLCRGFPAGSPRIHSEHLPRGRAAPSRRLSRRSQVQGLGQGLGQSCHLTDSRANGPGPDL